MNYSQALKWSQEKLDKANIGTSRLDCLVLLEDNLKIDRAKILSDPLTTIPASVLKKYKAQINKRSQHLPLAYIRHQSEFYGRVFFIDERVLEPRPESETIIDELKTLIKQNDNPQILDIGTGSGALAITLKLKFPELRVFATDINNSCLDVANLNANKLMASITFLKGDLTKAVPEDFWQHKTIVVANLPYVPNNWQINTAAGKEPSDAIFGGRNGLELYSQLFKQLSFLKTRPVWVICESMPPQHQQLTKIALKYGYHLDKTNDFIQCFNLVPRQVSN